MENCVGLKVFSKNLKSWKVPLFVKFNLFFGKFVGITQKLGHSFENCYFTMKMTTKAFGYIPSILTMLALKIQLILTLKYVSTIFNHHNLISVRVCTLMCVRACVFSRCAFVQSRYLHYDHNWLPVAGLKCGTCLCLCSKTQYAWRSFLMKFTGLLVLAHFYQFWLTLSYFWCFLKSSGPFES